MSKVSSNSLSEIQRRQLFASYASLRTLIRGGLDVSTTFHRPIDFIVALFNEAYGIDVLNLIDLAPVDSNILPIIGDTKTGDIALISEEFDGRELIPAVIFGVIAKQIVYFSPYFKTIIETDFDLHGIAYHNTEIVQYRTAKIYQAADLLSNAFQHDSRR